MPAHQSPDGADGGRTHDNDNLSHDGIHPQLLRRQNTGSPDRQALHVLSCDPATGAAKFVQSVSGIQGTTYFQVSPDGRFLYSVVGE